jgi:hypothetical protein
LGGALDLGAQIRSVLGYLLMVALLLWLERAAVSRFTALSNKFGAAGFFPLQIKAILFLAGRGGGGEKFAADLSLLASRGGEEEWKLWAVSSASWWWCCGCGCRRSSPLSGHGGAVRGGVLTLLCGSLSEGRSQGIVLIHAFGSRAAAILRRQDGVFSTSIVEACLLRRGCSRLSGHEVMRSPWLGSGPRRLMSVGRGLPSSWSLFLNSDASRTPASSGGGAQGLDCFRSASSRVLVVIFEGLSSNSRFSRARDAGAFVKLVPATFQ